MKRAPSSPGSCGWPTWATVLLSALGGAVAGAVAAALVMRRRPAPGPVAPPGPPVPTPVEVPVPVEIAPEAQAPPVASRPRRPRRRKGAGTPQP